MKTVSILILLACFFFFLNACASNPQPQIKGDLQDNANLENEMQAYKIGVDDQVKVSVWGNPELSDQMPVRPDGKITVPLIGDVVAAGQEPEKVASVIRERLSVYVRNPNVTVTISELRSHEFLSRVRVTGAVAKSLSMPYRPGMTVIDAVLEAGGVNEFSAPNRTKLHRKSTSSTEVFKIYLEDIMEEGDLQSNMQLRPGDIITVPERFF